MVFLVFYDFEESGRQSPMANGPLHPFLMYLVVLLQYLMQGSFVNQVLAAHCHSSAYPSHRAGPVGALEVLQGVLQRRQIVVVGYITWRSTYREMKVRPSQSV